MPSLYTVVRWIHVLAGAAWLGEVVIVVFVLIPALVSLQPGKRPEFVSNIFPRVFRLASVLAGTTLAAGLTLNYLLTGWRNLGPYFASTRGAAILIGGLLGALLAGFHFFVEARIEGRVVQLVEGMQAEQDRIERFLQVIPRVGLLILLVVFILMMVGARGF